MVSQAFGPYSTLQWDLSMEAQQGQAWLVPGWETTWESQVLLAFLLPAFLISGLGPPFPAFWKTRPCLGFGRRGLRAKCRAAALNQLI